MPAGVGIDLGDAVLRFLADTTQLDQAIDGVVSEVPAKVQPASNSITAMGVAWDKSGTSAKSAGASGNAAGAAIASAGSKGAAGVKQIDASTEALNARMKALEAEIVQLQAKIVALGEQGEGAGQRVGRGFNKAAAEAGLLGEATGVRLPRHVRALLSEIPGLGTAFAAAFEVTAVFFLIDAVIQLGEKLNNLLEKPARLAEEWKQVADSTIEAGHSMTKALDESKAKVIELTEGPLAAMDYKIRNIRQDSKEAAGEIGKIGDAVTKALNDQQANAFGVAFFGAFKETSRDTAKQATEFFKELHREVDLFGSGPSLSTLADELKKVDDEVRATTDSLKRDQSLTGQHFYQDRIDSLRQYQQALVDTQKILEDDRARQLKDQEAAADERRAKLGEDIAAQTRRNLDIKLAGIEREKIEQEVLYSQGKISAASWAEAQIVAANKAAQAQIDYKDKIAAVTKAYEDAPKASATAQDAALEKTKQQNTLLNTATEELIKLKEESKKLNEELAKAVLDPQKIVDTTHAYDALTQAELRLAETQKRLSEANIAADFSSQEAAVSRLASFSIISEEDKRRRLLLIYSEEEHDALAALNKLSQEQVAQIEVDKKKFEAASKDGFFPPDQLAELKTKYDQVRSLHNQTEAEITKTQEQFAQKRIGVTQQEVQESISIFTLAGQRERAAELQEAAAALTALQAQLKLSKARKEDTSDVEAQIKTTQTQVKQLQSLATHLDIASSKFQHFLQSYRSGDQLSKLWTRDMQSNSAAMQNFGAVAQAVSQEFGSAFATAISGAILGQESFGQALAKGTAQVLANLAAQSLVYALFYTAQGIADVFWNPPRAAADFTAAAEFAVVGGALGAAAFGVNQAVSGPASSSTNQNAAPSGPNSVANPPQPSSGVNVPRFALGALVSRPTLAMFGDAVNGGASREAVLPLDDPEAVRQIVEALGGGKSHGTHVVVNVQGMVSPDNLDKVIRQITHRVSTNRAHLLASDSVKHTRRSQ